MEFGEYIVWIQGDKLKGYYQLNEPFFKPSFRLGTVCSSNSWRSFYMRFGLSNSERNSNKNTIWNSCLLLWFVLYEIIIVHLGNTIM